MKILVVSQYWHPENGVPQRRWEWLTRVLQDAGHEVVVIAPPPHYKRKISAPQWFASRGFSPSLKPETGPNGETILRSGYFPSGASLTHKILGQGWTALAMTLACFAPRGRLSKLSPDLVVGTVPALPTAMVTFLIATRLRIPYVVDLRDAWPDLFRDSREWNRAVGPPSRRQKLLSRGPFQLLTWMTEKSIRCVLARAAGVVTTSHSLELELPKVEGQQTTTVRNVFPALVEPIGAERATRDAGRLNVLYAGTLGRAQRLENAIRAVRIAQEQYGLNIMLRLVGDGAAREALEQVAAANPDAIEMHAQCSPEDLGSHYEWADTALVHLTGWGSLRTAIPSKTYELMRMGIHISAVIAGETADLVKSLQAGSVVPPDDPLALAREWAVLAKNRHLLVVNDRGRHWVENEYQTVAPANFLRLIHASSQRHPQGEA